MDYDSNCGLYNILSDYSLKMISFLKRNKALFFVSVLLFLLVVWIARLFIEGRLNETVLKANKESITIVFESIKMLILIVGAVAAYLKFFKGHLFLSKFDMNINHKLIPIGLSNKIHFLDIEIDNNGQYTIYNPVVMVNVSFIPELQPPLRVMLKDGSGRINEQGKKINHVIRSGTVTSLPYQYAIDDPDVLAMKFEIVIELKRRSWKKVLIVENRS